MKVNDEAMWHGTQAELLSHGELGQQMLEFTTDWADRAEFALQAEQEFQQEDGSWSGPNPAEALRMALPAVEVRFGQITVSAISQALIVILGNWVHGGSEIFDNLTIIEQRVVSDMLSMQQMEMAKAAQVTTAAADATG